MYKKVLVCTHGRFGEELIKSVEMIAGPLTNTVAVSLLPGMSVEEYHEKLRTELDKENETLCLVDIFGGTPSHSVLYMSQEYPLDIICGVNLPVLLESSTMTSYDSKEEFKEHLIDVYKTNGYDVLERMRNNGNSVS